MYRFRFLAPYLALCTCLFFSCTKENTADSKLHFQFKFDANQERLNNLGLPATLPAGHAAQNPDFKGMSVHYIELAPSALTQLGEGQVLYEGVETNTGGTNAIDFANAQISDGSSPFLTLDRSALKPGSYEWVRVSVSYQTYDVLFNLNNIPFLGDLKQQKARIASFVGFNTYIEELQVNTQSLTVNTDKKQGFWAFETDFDAPNDQYNQLSSGEAPAGATTVVNPLADSSPIPAGSCVVTGRFAEPLVITGEENEDILIELAFSVNQSFEWKDKNGNGALDFYVDNPSESEQIIDMGLRGLKVFVR